jgi:uncharacterized membrane protein YeaQ/YmgE (transglycosylase-associated protein family)
MFWLIWTIVIGILAGFLAGQVVRGRSLGTAMNLLVGIIGSILGGWLFGGIGLVAYGLLGRLFTAFVGAVILLLLVRALKRA